MTTTMVIDALPRRTPWGWLVLAVILWIAAYANLTPFADAVVALTGSPRQTHLGEVLHFFFYDTPKVLLLPIAIVFVMGIVHTFISSERTLQPEPADHVLQIGTMPPVPIITIPAN